MHALALSRELPLLLLCELHFVSSFSLVFFELLVSRSISLARLPAAHYYALGAVLFKYYTSNFLEVLGGLRAMPHWLSDANEDARSSSASLGASASSRSEPGWAISSTKEWRALNARAARIS